MPRRDLSRVRHAQRAQPGVRPANARGDGRCSRCSACTAWARRCTTTRPTRCGSMRRSARTRTCSPIWCGGCWRTAPIPASCIAWSIRRCPKRRSSPIPWRGCARSAPAAIRAFPCRAISIRTASIPPASISPIARRRPRCSPQYTATPTARATCRRAGNPQSRRSPHAGRCDRRCGPAQIDAELDVLARGWREWDCAGGAHRAAVLERAADLIEASRDELLFLLAREGGKTLGRRHRRNPRGRRPLPLVRAACARRDFAEPRELPGPTGERNTWALGGRGVFAAISPWNFPLAIFTGQVAAALAAGNAVAAKPAEQTPLVAARAVALLLEAGVPRTALALLPGDGTVGQALVNDARIAGVAFTGGTETAQVDRAIAGRAARADRSVHRRDRRHQRDDRRQFGTGRAGGDRRAHQRVRFGRPALLRAAPAVPAGRHRRPRAAHAARRGGDAGDRRSAGSGDRCRPGDRRRCARVAGTRRGTAWHAAVRAAAAAGHRTRQLLRAARLPAERCERAADGDLRSRSVHRPLRRRPAGRSARRDRWLPATA